MTTQRDTLLPQDSSDTRRKRVLAIAWLPIFPINSGYRQRTWAFFNALANYHDVLLFAPDTQTPSNPGNLKWATVSSQQARWRFSSVLPKHHLRFSRAKVFAQAVCQHAREFQPDLVVAEGLWASRAALACRQAINCPVALVAQNLESVSAHGVYPRMLVQLLKKFETHMIRQSDLVWAVTQTDQQIVAELIAHHPPDCWLVPNGCNPPPVADIPKIEQFRAQRLKPSKTTLVVFTGSLNYPPNRKGLAWLTENVVPLFGAESPYQFEIAGPGRIGHDTPSIRWCGFEPDLPLLLAAADVCIAPVWHGSGSSIKVLEYLAAARPVVATSVACRGLGVTNHQHLMIADSPSEFAEAIKTLAHNPQLAQQLGQAGQRYVLSQWSWDAIAQTVAGKIVEFLPNHNPAR